MLTVTSGANREETKVLFVFSEPKHLQSADHICKALHKKRWSKRLQSAAKRLNGTLTCEIEGKRTEELKSEERGAEISGWRRWSGCLRRRVVLSEEAATVGGSSNRRRRLRETSSRPQTLNHVFPPADPYTINIAKAIFLNQRAQSRSSKGPANSCFTCDRILQEPFHLCSLS
ncbi:hypothetical protein LXL04_028870 [Taraxacum kok-saghyz]